MATKLAKSDLSTSALPHRRNKDAVVSQKYGGIELYAYGAERLESEVNAIRSGVGFVVRDNGPLAPSLIRYLLEKRLKIEVSQRVFSALLGAELRCGHLDVVLCESETGKIFRIVIEELAKPNFVYLLRECLALIPESKEISISAIRDQLYPGGADGAWTKASYLASRLVRLGLVGFSGKFLVRRNSAAFNAIGEINNPVFCADLTRLD